MEKTKGTLTRFAETFVTVFLTTFAASEIFGTSFDVSTPEGQSGLAAAIGSAILIALRRAWAVRNA